MLDAPRNLPLGVSVVEAGRNVRSIFAGRFLGQIVTVISGAAAAQAINIAAVPIVSRLYTPESFGLLGTFMAMLMLLSTVAGMSYPAAIVIPPEEDEGHGIAALSILCGCALACLLAFVVLFFRHDVARLLRIEAIEEMLLLVPALVVFESTFQAGQQWMIRTQRYALTARIGVLQALFSAATKILGGLLFPTARVLVGAAALAVPFHALAIYVILNKGPLPRYWPGVRDPRRILRLARSYRDFPLFRAPHSLIWSINQNLPALLIVRLIDASAGGFFSIANALVNLPSQIIAKAINDVFMPKLATAAAGRRPIAPLVLSATALLFVIGAVFCAAFVFAAPWLFATILGPRWVAAGGYAQWLSLLALTTITACPSYCAITVMRIQQRLVLYELLSIAARGGALLLGSTLNPGTSAPIAVLAVTGGVMHILLIVVVAIACRARDERRLDDERSA